MIETDVCLYMVSNRRIALLEKVVAYPAIPRLGEFVRLANREQGDYFAFSVAQVTHREDGRPEVWLQLIAPGRDRSTIDTFEDAELDGYVAGYCLEGWTLASLKPNRTSLHERRGPMTSLLRHALAEAEKLPTADQDAIAARLLAEVEDEREWSARFAATTDDQWDRIAAEVRRDVAANGTRPLDEVFPPGEPLR